jgi:hypothetical protein
MKKRSFSSLETNPEQNSERNSQNENVSPPTKRQKLVCSPADFINKVQSDQKRFVWYCFEGKIMEPLSLKDLDFSK